MQVYLKGQSQPVALAEVERDDKAGIIGVTNSGKRFVAARGQIADPDAEPEPTRNPYRIYATDGRVIRTIEPEFAEAEAFVLDALADLDDAQLSIQSEDGVYEVLTHANVRSVLSAVPEAARAAALDADALDAE